MFTLIKQQGIQDFYYCKDGQWHTSAELNAVIKPCVYRTENDARKAWGRMGKPAITFCQEIKTRDKKLLA
jgi:hypothetical protein